MAEKTRDQSMLDVWATGYGSGMVHILERVLGLSEPTARRLAGEELNRLTRDPIATEALLGILKNVWAKEHHGEQNINDAKVYVIEAHGDPH